MDLEHRPEGTKEPRDHTGEARMRNPTKTSLAPRPRLRLVGTDLDPSACRTRDRRESRRIDDLARSLGLQRATRTPPMPPAA